MRRRSYLSLAGTVLAGLAGCTGSPGGSVPTPTGTEPRVTTTPTPTPRGPRLGDDLPSDPDPDDGYPPAFQATPAKRSIDTSTFGTTSVDGIEVPLAPIGVTYYWYARGEARFADARGSGQYDRSHVYGAVSSPQPEGGANDPVDDWPTGDRVVCYCTCPHHLSSIRASRLIDAGYEEVYVIDEGFGDWFEREYPMAGSNVASLPDPWVIEGMADRRYAGEMVLARHRPTDQTEAAPIAEDGTYRLELRFSDVSADSSVLLETPGYRVEDRLGDLTAGLVGAAE